MGNISIAFFTEAGSKRGMGHLIRCNTIFLAFKKKGFNVEFFLDSDISFEYKFEYIKYFTWDNLEISKKYTIIFIDSYLAKTEIYKRLLKKCDLLVCIDDYGRLEYPENSIIINFAPEAEKLFFNEKRKKIKYLLGLDYLPIRENFLKINKNIEKEHILIILGGGLNIDLYKKVLNSLSQINTKKVFVTNCKELKKFKKKDIEIVYKPSDEKLVEVMVKSKLAISTASMSVYELNYLNIPNIIVAVSKDQEIGLPQFLRYKLTNYFISFQDKFYEKDLKKYISNLENENSLYTVIDGKGTKRIVKECLELIKI